MKHHLKPDYFCPFLIHNIYLVKNNQGHQEKNNIIKMQRKKKNTEKDPQRIQIMELIVIDLKITILNMCKDIKTTTLRTLAEIKKMKK